MQGRSIKQYLLASWLIPALVAVAGSAVLSVGVSYLDYSNHRQSIEARLHENAPIIARRVAAELLLKDNGRLDAVRAQLIADFKLNALEVVESPSEHKSHSLSSVVVSEPIPGVSPQVSVHIVGPGPEFTRFINFRNFLFALLPILTLVLSGFLIQRKLLRRYVIRPIEALAETSIGSRPVKAHWPLEIKKIASDLADSFSNREQAVFGQLSRGLIHDIRTQINSVHTALQLAKEAESNSPDRVARLEKLETACTRNIPKLCELLELSLDSSREIVVRPRPSDISKTLQQSVQNIQELADSRNIIIITRSAMPIQVSHDSLQLERVFTNLIKNAVEAVEETSNSKRNVEVLAETTPSGINVVIEDSGHGFSDLKQIFRPLKTTKSRGHGLGLFVSKKIVQAHNGTLEASLSTRLGGAKFTVSLPNREASV